MCKVSLKTAGSLLAKRVAGEDLARGDYVTVMTEMEEYPSFFWLCDAPLLAIDELVCLKRKPPTAGQPLKVIDICLPFVLVEQMKGKHKTLDLRTCELARLDAHYGKQAWKLLSKQQKKRKSKRKRAK